MEVYSSALTTIIVLQSVTWGVWGLTCYQCTATPPQDHRKPQRLCAKFNTSADFQVECPFSTFCMKKTFSLYLRDKYVSITTRDCASQKEMLPVERNGIPEWEPNIAEVYDEGCRTTTDKGHTDTSQSEMCYCRAPLCNGQAPHVDATVNADIMAVIMAYNAIKYVGSLND